MSTETLDKYNAEFIVAVCPQQTMKIAVLT